MEKGDAINDASAAEYSGKQLAILTAAEELIAQNGFDGTSVRDIAQHAGVNVAMISYYFGSKERLLEAIVVHRMSSSGMMLEGLLHNTNLDPVQKIHQLVETYVERMLENPFYHKIIIREQMTIGAETFKTLLGKVKFQNLQMVKGLVAEGVRKKVFNKSVDVSLLMSTMFGTFYQVISNVAFYRKCWNMEALQAAAFDIQLRKNLKYI